MEIQEIVNKVSGTITEPQQTNNCVSNYIDPTEAMVKAIIQEYVNGTNSFWDLAQNNPKPKTKLTLSVEQVAEIISEYKLSKITE